MSNKLLRTYYDKYTKLLKMKMGDKRYATIEKMLHFIESRLGIEEKDNPFLELELIIGLLGSLGEPYTSKYAELRSYCDYMLTTMQNDPTRYLEVYDHYATPLYHLREYLELKAISPDTDNQIPLEVQKVIVELLKNFSESFETLSIKKGLSHFITPSVSTTDLMRQKEQELTNQLLSDMSTLNRQDTASTRYEQLRGVLNDMLDSPEMPSAPTLPQIQLGTTKEHFPVPTPMIPLQSQSPVPIIYTKDDILENFNQTTEQIKTDLEPHSPESLQKDVHTRFLENKED